MKICAISDLHGTLPELPDGIDLLLICGDIAWEETIKKEEKWFIEKFNPWVTKLNIPTIYIGGNHDFYLEKYKANDVGIYLENKYHNFNGINIFGTPLSLEVGPWVWQAKEDDIDNVLRGVKCDILMSHGPAYGYGDRVINYNLWESVGSFALRDWISNFQPKLVIHGHIHSGFGCYRLGETIILNCAITNDNLRPTNKLFCINWNLEKNNIDTINEFNGLTSKYTKIYH